MRRFLCPACNDIWRDPVEVPHLTDTLCCLSNRACQPFQMARLSSVVCRHCLVHWNHCRRCLLCPDNCQRNPNADASCPPALRPLLPLLVECNHCAAQGTVKDMSEHCMCCSEALLTRMTECHGPQLQCTGISPCTPFVCHLSDWIAYILFTRNGRTLVRDWLCTVMRNGENYVTRSSFQIVVSCVRTHTWGCAVGARVDRPRSDPDRMDVLLRATAEGAFTGVG